MLSKEEINKFISENFSEESMPELNVKVSIKGEEVSVKNLLKAAYEKGLSRSYDEELKKRFSFSRDVEFKSNGLFPGYYVVAHLYSEMPELCYFNGQCLRTVSENIYISENDIIGAVEINIPSDILEEVKKWREMNTTKVVCHDIADSIVYQKNDREEQEYNLYLRLKQKFEEPDEFSCFPKITLPKGSEEKIDKMVDNIYKKIKEETY